MVPYFRHGQCSVKGFLLLVFIGSASLNTMTLFWSVNYIFLVYKLKFLFWTCLKLWVISVTSKAAYLELYFLLLFGGFGNFFLWQKIFQNLIFVFSYYSKTAELVLEKLSLLRSGWL